MFAPLFGSLSDAAARSRLLAGSLALIGFMSWLPAANSQPDVPNLNLAELIAIAQRDNRDLQAARYAIEIGRGRLQQSGLLPNPRLALSSRSDAAFKDQGEYANSAGISQDFPIAGRIMRQKDVARVDVALAMAEVAEAERKLAGEVAANVYSVLIVDRQIQSRSELLGVVERLAQTTRDRLKAAEVSELDVNTVQLDLQRLSQERDVLQNRRRSLVVSLNTLLGRSAQTPLAIAEPLPETDVLPAPEQLLAKAMQNRPDFRMVSLSADRALAEKGLAKAQRWEDWSIGIGLEQDRAAIDGAPPQESDRALALSLSIPLPLLNRNQGAIAAAEASANQARSRIEALRLAIAGEVAAAHGDATNLQAVVGHYRQELLPVSARNVELAQKGYSQGLVSVIEAVQAQRQQAEVNAAYLDALDQYMQALVRLRTAAGDYLRPATEDK